jgi:hypothetical protein
MAGSEIYLFHMVLNMCCLGCLRSLDGSGAGIFTKGLNEAFGLFLRLVYSCVLGFQGVDNTHEET